MQKVLLTCDNKKIIKYLWRNIPIFTKEKTPTVKRIRVFGICIFKSTKPEYYQKVPLKEKTVKILGIPLLKTQRTEFWDNGVKKSIYIFNIKVIKLYKTGNRKDIRVLNFLVWKRDGKYYYLFGVNISMIYLSPINYIIKIIRRFKHLTFPVYENPTVSIIIPVYNQYDYTIGCLCSILESQDPISYEIIIADDCSNDETINISKHVSNIKVSRTHQNLGYIKNVNNAAKLAKGKYLYFLNNDTLVQRNWLSELVHVFDLKKDAGVVGSKVYNEDLSLQECGVFMFSNCFANRFNADPSYSRYMYLKQVDYVSGCSFLTPKALFDEIGGFDLRFSPAYCDDPDYCIAALYKGYKTYVQPKSKIIHFCGRSYNSRSNPLMNRNNVLLRQKWNDYFMNRSNSNDNYDYSGLNKPKTILIVDDYLPQFDRHAGGKTIFQYCQLFVNMGLNVKFCSFIGKKEEPYYSILSDMGIEIIEGRNVHDWIERNANRLDYLFLSRPQIAQNFLIKRIQAMGIKVLYYGHDVHHIRMAREEQLTNKHVEDIENVKLIETVTMRCVDWCYYPSKVEEQYIREQLHCENVSTVPPYLYKVEDMPKHLSFDKSSGIVFVGSCYGPNEGALIWFIDNILPIVVAQIPNIVLKIVSSSKLSDEVKKRSGDHVEVLGYLTEDELSELYSKSKVSIAPLLYGAGIKGKVVDAIYHNTPVVTTDIGAEGLDLFHGCINVGNTVEEFAKLVVDLYTQEENWNKQVSSCKQFIAEHYTFEKAVEIFSKQIEFKTMKNSDFPKNLPVSQSIDDKEFIDTDSLNVLYFAPISLYPKGRGNTATVHQYIDRLRNNGHRVHYVLLDDSNESGQNIYIAQQYVDSLDVILNKAKRSKRKDGYYDFDSWFFQELGELISELCIKYKIDCVICTYVMYSKIFDFVKGNVLKILDTHDKMTDRHLFLRSHNIKDEFFSCTKDDEANYLKRADIIWARNQAETDYFNQITNSNKAITVSHFDRPHFLNKSIQQIKRFGFLASDNHVNERLTLDFIKYFIEKYSDQPIDIELIIGGNVLNYLKHSSEIQQAISKYPIKFTGFYSKIEDFYNDIDCVVCPITFGTGINIKMIEAMSFGLPILSTENGIKGVKSDSVYHHFNTPADLLNGLWSIYNNKSKIQDLTEQSKKVFEHFYNENVKSFDLCFHEYIDYKKQK